MHLFSWRRLKYASILFAFVFGLLAVLVAGRAILQAQTERMQRAALQEAVTVRAEGAALAFAKALSEDWNRAKWTARRIAESSGAERQVALDSLLSTPGRVSWAGFADRLGVIRAATGGLLVGADASSRPWFAAGLQRPYSGDAHEAVMLARSLGAEGDEPLRFLDFALPVKDGSGTTLGVLAVHIDVRWAQSYLAEISARLGIDLLVIDAQGNVSVSGLEPPATWMPRRLDGLAVDGGRLVEWTDGQSYFTALVPEISVDDMAPFGWRLVARIRPDALSNLATPANNLRGRLQADSQARSLQAVFAILATIAGLAAGAALLFNSRASRSSAAAETALKRLVTSEERFKTLFSSASLPIAVIRDQTYQAVNDAAARLLGFGKASDIEGRTFLDISPDVQWDGVRSVDKLAAIAADLRKGTVRFDWLHCKADGSTILLDVLLTEVRSETGRDVFAVWTDVTARRKAEDTLRDYQNTLERAVTERTEELEATQSALSIAKDRSDQLAKQRSDFLATMSHEIRGPLNALIGFVELAAEGKLSAQQAGFMDKAVQAGRHLAGIVDDVLDLTRAEAGRLTLENVEFDLIDLAHSTLEIVQPMLRKKPVELILTVDPDLPDAVTTDPLRLRQILLNYLTNAAKFTERGTIRLDIRRVVAGSGSVLRFTVEDTGIGLRPDQKDRLFQSFSQADVSTARLYGGSGLGLAICQQLADLMDGRVGFESEAGQGSRFWLELPCHGHLCGPDRPAGTGRVVWLGLSDPRLRDNLAAWLRRDGFDVTGLGPEPPPSDDVCLVHDPAAEELAPWLARTLHPQRFVLTSGADASPQGTAVTVHTPVDPRRLVALLSPSRQVAAEGREEKAAPVRYPARLKVLVADDDRLNRDLATARLKKAGLTVFTAGNGIEALEAVLRERFDLILMDHHMPVMDGVEATRRIRALPAPRGCTPVVGISGSDRAEVRQACEAAGMNSFLLKPLNNAGLAAVLRTFLRA